MNKGPKVNLKDFLLAKEHKRKDDNFASKLKELCKMEDDSVPPDEDQVTMEVGPRMRVETLSCFLFRLRLRP